MAPAVIPLPYRDRRQAGRVLAEHLVHLQGHADVAVFALPRGGVAIGYEVARALDAPLDVLVVRKLGLPGYEEYAIGAIAGGGVQVMNLAPGARVPPREIARVLAREQAELERRERLYRGHQGPVEAAGRTVILTDDGLATGSTMRAAIAAVRQRHPARVIVAVPVGAEDTCARLRDEADEVVCPARPNPLRAVGLWYEQFPQAEDDEVHDLLAAARREHAAALH